MSSNSDSLDRLVSEITLLGNPTVKMEKYNKEHGSEKKYLIIEELLVDTLVRLNTEKYRSLNVRENDVRAAYLDEIMRVLHTTLKQIQEFGTSFNISVNKQKKKGFIILLLLFIYFFKGQRVHSFSVSNNCCVGNLSITAT